MNDAQREAVEHLKTVVALVNEQTLIPGGPDPEKSRIGLEYMNAALDAVKETGLDPTETLVALQGPPSEVITQLLNDEKRE